MLYAARPPEPGGVPANRGWPDDRSERAGAVSRPSPPRRLPPQADDGRWSVGGSGVRRGREEADAARGRRGEGAKREEAVKPAGGCGAVAVAAGGAEWGAGLAAPRGEERGSGGGEPAVRKRGLESGATRPPLKRRVVSARRQFPPGCGRDAAAALIAGRAEERLPLVPSTSHDALENVAVAPHERRGGGGGGSEEHGSLFEAMFVDAGSGAIDQKVVSADGGTAANTKSSSDILNGNAVSIVVPALLAEKRGRSVGSCELRTKEWSPISPLPPKRRKVSARRSFPPGCGRNAVPPLASQRGDDVRLQLEAVPTDGGCGAAEVERRDAVVVDNGDMDVMGALSKGLEGQELEEGEFPPEPEPHHDVTVSITALDDSPRGRHEPLMRYAFDELSKCMEGLQREGKDAAQAVQIDLKVGSTCRMSLPASADKSSAGILNGGKGRCGSNCGMNREPVGLAVGDSVSDVVESKVQNMEKPSEAHGCLGATSIIQVYGQGTSNTTADVQELEEGEFVVEADDVAQESHVTADVILHEPTDDRHDSAAPAMTTAETCVGRLSDKKICQNTLQLEGKSAPGRVTEDVKMVNNLPRNKIVCTARKSVRPPLKEHRKALMDTLPRSLYEGKNEKSVAPVIESLAPMKKSNEKSIAAVIETLAPRNKLNEKHVASVKESLASRNKLNEKPVASIKEPLSPPRNKSCEKPVASVKESLSPTKKSNEKSVADVRGSLAPSKKSNEKFFAAVGESNPPRMKLNVKGPAQTKHLPVNTASTSTLVRNKKLKDKWGSNLEDDDILEALAIHEEMLKLYLNAPACVPSVARYRQHVGQKVDARSEVRMMCMRFQFLCRFLVHSVEQSSLNCRRVDLAAAKIIRKVPGFTKHDPIVGNVPGVEVGDEFLYRVELALVGLHLLYQGGIGFTKVGGVSVAISIVASGGYPDELSGTDELIYTGSGGKPAGKKADEDQKLERGNLALKNCIQTKTPVRVIHGFKGENREASRHSRAKQISTFTYDGLYRVVEYWREGRPGSRVFKYRLQRIPGQPEFPLRIAKRLRKSLVRPGLCVSDISQGNEKIPICVINDVDNARPAPFKYIIRIKYPPLLTKKRPQGCDCTNNCSDSTSCSCTVKNGGEIPFNFDGAVVRVKPLIFECGPSCGCPPSCPNRVSQHGMKIPLEIFRTSKTGWGVRSLRSIPSGSFICEYVGELLHDKEAENRPNDEYLFEVGRNYNDEDLWKGLPSVPGLNSSSPCSQTMEDMSFTIDAVEYGNIGRFINHSCSPNLYAQNVLWDHGDQKMPRIMFFAVDNIPPLQELTYDYNYKIDHVYDVNGKKKVKYCHCGSPHCCGRLY